MDVSQQRQFISFIKSLPQKPATTIRFFSRTEYYVVYGSDAPFISKEVFRSTSQIKTLGSGNDTLEYVNLNKSQFEALIRDLLLIKQYRVEVLVNKGTKHSTSWGVEYKGSPGNLAQFEDILFSNSDQIESSSVMSIKVGGDAKNKVVGLAIVDVVEHTFTLTQFSDDDHFSTLEAVIVQFGPKECLVPNDSTPDIINVKKIVERCRVLLTARKKGDFSKENLVQDLNRLVKFEDDQQPNSNTLPQMAWTHAMSALNASIKYLELCGDNDNFGKFVVSNLGEGRFVHLDSAALSALSLAPAPGSSSYDNTVIGLLDKCRTSHGHRLLCQWVKQPLKDLNVINERHDIVEVFLKDTLMRQSLHEDHLKRVPDFQSLSKRLLRKKANLQDCYRIYQGLERLPSLIKTLEGDDGSPHPTLRAVIIEPLKEQLADTEKFQEMIMSTIDMDLVDKGEYLVKPEFDQDLQNLREKMDDLLDRLSIEMKRVAQDIGLEANKGIKLESNAQYGYFFRVTLKDEKAIRNNKVYTQLDANKSGVRFKSNGLSLISDEYSSVKEDYFKHQQSVVDEVISIAVGYCGTLHQTSSLLAQLDVLCSFAVVAAAAPTPYVRPTMTPMGTGKLHLVQARHPCLELIDTVSYIPNDVYFSQGECTFNILTGPNMGGKSTYIRSVGVVALLAHIGSLVPCDEAEIPVLDAIMARVGANDSQIKAMSTFMVEMVETTSIIKTATSNSLVIIDELGRGTSTYEGCGIAWAIAEYLAKEAKAFCLFATHFHELTQLADEAPTVRNLHVTAITSDQSLTLLYQVRPGALDQSFGIHVARMANFPDIVVEDAKRKLAELEDFQSAIDCGDDVKKRKLIKEGEEIMKEILDECKELPIDTMSDEEIKLKVESLKAKALERHNPYIEIIVNKTSIESQS